MPGAQDGTPGTASALLRPGVFQYPKDEESRAHRRGRGLAYKFRGLRQRLLAAGLLGLAGLAHAATDPFAPGQTDFLVGVEAFHAGDYEAALEGFQRARAAGFKAPTLEFNLGLSQYKLGRYAQAGAVFQQLLGNPEFADVAEFHLGLVAAQLGQTDAAVAHLRKVERGARSPKLKALAQTALERILGRPAPSRSSVYLSGGLGYDSNPVLLSDGAGRVPGQGPDWFGEAIGSYGYTLAARDASSDQLRGSLYLRQYRKDTDLSQQDATLAYEHAFWGQGWRIDLGAAGETFYLGGDNLLSSGGLTAEGSRRLGAGTFSLRWQGNRVFGGSGSTYLDGWQQQAQLAWSAPLGDGRLRAQYDFESNARRDLDTGAEFFSESPTRHGASLRLSEPLGERLSLDLRATYRYSRYHAPDRFFTGPTLAEQRRSEELTQLAATARYRLYPGWNLLMHYDYSRNQANIPGFQYHRNQASLALEWLEP